MIYTDTPSSPKETAATRLILFDFDGVVADSEVISLATLRQALEDFGVTMTIEEVRKEFLGGSINRFEAYVATNGTRPPDGFARHWYEMVFTRFRAELKVMPGFLPLLDLLDSLQIDYCIASGGSFQRLGVALEAIGLTQRLEGRVFSADLVEHGKPHPDLFLYSAAQMGVAAKDCLVIEDSIAGIIAAKAARMRVFGFVGGSHLSDIQESYLEGMQAHHVDDVIHSFGELSDKL